MNWKINFILVITIFVSVWFFSGNPPGNATIGNNIILAQSQGSGHNFIVGSLNSGWDVDYLWTQKTLNFNLWQIYGGNDSDINGRHYPIGWVFWAVRDSLFTHIDNYRSGVRNALYRIASHNMAAMMNRPKIDWLCYGQRSDYQCEYVAPDNDLWFYSFNSNDPGHVHTGASIEDNSVYGNRVRVKKCKVGIDPEGYVVDRLKANAEQSNPGTSYQNGDSKREWFIKPRIRIDSSFANNPNNLNTPVCRISVLNQFGNVFKEVILRSRHFLIDSNDSYSGKYIEEYKYDPLLDTAKLRHYGSWSPIPQYYSSRGEGPESEAFNHSDIQVYWYGHCDMWIDYVRVEDDVADRLFKGYFEQPGREWLLWEANDIACSLYGTASWRFYIELFEFNNLPCMEYVSRKLDSISFKNCGKHINLLAMPIPITYTNHLPWRDRFRIQNAEHLKKNFVDSVGEQEFFLGFFPFNSSYHWPEPDPYPTWTRIPNTLPRHNGPGILARAIEPNAYDEWLQNYLDSTPYSFEQGYTGGIRSPVEEDPGGFRYAMKFGDSVSKLADIPFLYNPQAHIWFCQCGAGGEQFMGKVPREITGEVQREPTNEELDLTINVAISYGVRGIVWFEMLSTNDTGDTFYSRGIVNPWFGNPMPGPPRYANIYLQPKWEKIISISKRLNNWSPYIMSFNNADRHSYIYRLENERNDCINNSYFDEILSYAHDTQSNVKTYYSGFNSYERNGLRLESNNDRFLQIATFNTIPGVTEQYFMIVNRRGSPIQPDHRDGERFISIRLDTNSIYFPGYKDWFIFDVENNEEVVKFDKMQNSTIDLGWYEPGAGKLYKIIPEAPPGIPKFFSISQNFPNPFNPVTTIKYQLAENSKVKLIIYDVLGRELKTLINENKPAGYFSVNIDMQNFASGVYFYRFEAQNLKTRSYFVDAKKMVLVK